MVMTTQTRIERFFSTIGLMALVFGGLFFIAEGMLRQIPPADALDSAEQKKMKTVDELCEGEREAYDSADGCYYAQDDVAYMTYSTFFGHFPKASSEGRGWKTNAQHMRYDEDFPAQKEEGEIRVFITGGSTAWGAGVRQKNLYSYAAESALKKSFPGRKIRVISAGVGGYVSWQELAMFRYIIRDFQPDIWVMFTGWNDVYYGYKGKKEYTSPDMMKLRNALANAPVRSSVLIERFDGGIDASLLPPKWSDYSLKTHFFIDRLLFQLRGKQAEKQLLEKLEDTQIPVDMMVEEFMQNIRSAQHLAKDSGVKFMVYLQPTLYKTSKKLTAYEQAIVDNNAKRFLGLPEYHAHTYEKIRNALKGSETLHYVDADDAIIREHQSVFADHVHFGDRGNQLIGEHLATTLEPMIEQMP